MAVFGLKKYTMCGSSLFVGNVFDGPRYSMYCVIYLHLPYKRPAGYEGFCHPLNTRSCHDFHRVTVDGRNPKANHLGCVKPFK